MSSHCCTLLLTIIDVADSEAKKVAQGLASTPAELPRWLTATPLPASLSKVRQLLNDTFKKQAKAEWELSPCATQIARVDPSIPSKNYLQLTVHLPR